VPRSQNFHGLQVSNRTDAIKIACDFLSIENLPASHQLTGELRAQRLIHNWPEDVLQLEITLWHAWNSLHKLRGMVTIPPPMLGVSVVSATETLSAIDSDINTIVVNTTDDASSLVTKIERKRQKRQERRRYLAITKRPHKPGHDCRCPRCPGFFNKSGLLSHM
jgi:hypothetical protein